MADITVDVNLPSSVSVDVTSPTQSLATNVSIPGPQGPRGEKGNPTSINNLTAENIIITGSDGNVAYTSGTSTIFISGNSGYFQSAVNSLTTNLNSTGANLNTSINSLSGLFTGYTGTLDATYATDSQLANTGSTLNTKIDNLSGYVNFQDSIILNNLISTESALLSNINTLSSNLNSTGSNLENKITSLSGTLTGNYLTTNSASSTYATITNLNSTGSTLNSSISSLSGTLTSNYATINNLALTGSNLNTKIDNFSGTYQNFVNNLDSSYATDVQLENTGSTLSQNINNLSGTLINNYYLKSNPSGFITGVDLSSYLTSSTASSTYATINNLTSTGTSLNNNINALSGTLTSNYATITNLVSTGSTLTSSINSLNSAFTGFTGNLDATYATDSQLATTGTTLVNSISSLSGTLTSNYATITNLASTGSTLVNTISSLSGTLTSTYATITNLASTGSTLTSSINSLSGTLTSTYATISNLASTGSNLQTQINNLDNVYATDTSVTSVSNNLASTGSTLDSKINSLSGSAVLLYGNQSVGGIKTFRDNVYINNLFVTGTETIVNTPQINIASNYLLLNLTGGAVDGGIFFVTGSGFTGVNDSGPIIGFDHVNKFKFGVSTRNSDLSTLPDIASVQDIQAYSGVANNTFSTISNLASTGSTLNSSINSLSGTLTSNYATITNLASTGSTLTTNLINTGSTLDTKINNLSGYINSTGSNILFTTGDQTINGNKSFTSSSVLTVKTISGFKGSTPDTLNLIAASNNTVSAGIDLAGSINLTAGTGSIYGTPVNGNVNLYAGGSKYDGAINVNGNININNTSSLSTRNIIIYKTGMSIGSPAQIAGLTIDNNNISLNDPGLGGTGFGLLISGVLVTPALYATSANLASTGSTLVTNLATTGSTLDTKINNLSGVSVLTFGDQTISGVKTFANGSNQILNTTYSTLTGLKAISGLLSGQLYRISDFVLKWNNQSYNDQTVKTAASGEPLIVTALSNKQIYHLAQSEIYPQDTIYYNIDAIGSYSWGTINNNTSIPDFKGWIYRRVDNLLNIDIPYDWRNITVNCCKPDVSSVPNYFPNVQYTRLDYVKETGNNSNRGKLYYSTVTGNSGNALNNNSFWSPVSAFVESGTFFSTDEVYAFRALYDDMDIEDFIISLPALISSRIQQPTFTSTLTGLGAFTLNNVKNIKIEGGYSNVIVGSSFYNNTIGNSFYNNTIGNNFYDNTIGSNFFSNTIGNTFAANIIGTYFYYNTIENGFYDNTIGNGFNSNTIGNTFFSNTIGATFFSNTIGNSFGSNSISDYFNSNSIRNGFNSNIAENNFNNVDFSSSTHVYNPYNTTLFQNSASSMRLRYFNSSDQLVVTDPTA